MTTPHYVVQRVFWLTDSPVDYQHSGMVDGLRAFCELCPLPDCCRASGDFTGVTDYPDCLVARIKANQSRR